MRIRREITERDRAPQLTARMRGKCVGIVGFGLIGHQVAKRLHGVDADVAYYRRSPDVTLYVLHNSAHCHNVASTRTQLWDRIGVRTGQQAEIVDSPDT